MLKFYRVTAGSRDLRKPRFDYILYIAENNININKKNSTVLRASQGQE